jgi:hypothetical protein
MGRSVLMLCVSCIAALSLASGCSASSGESAAETDSALFGGVGATSAKFNAVGSVSIVLNDQTGLLQHDCSGALIGPHTVLTAAHCVVLGRDLASGLNSLKYLKTTFRLGTDADAPTREIRAVSVQVGPHSAGGIANSGSDIGILQLAEDVTDVTPLALSPDPLTIDDVGRDFYLAGFGAQHPTDPVLGAPALRQFGKERLIALTGDALVAIFPKVADYIKYVLSVNPAADPTALATFYNTASRPMVLGEQAGFTGVKGNGVQACSGDAGGPVLRSKNGNLEIVGLTFGIMASTAGTCIAGNYVGLVGSPDSKAFIANALADVTRGIPATGACDETLAVKVNPPNEGEPAVSTVDCRDLGLVCGADATGQSTCVDPPSAGPASTCSIVGTWLSGREEFRADGTFTLSGDTGKYTLSSGILALTNDTVPAATCAANPLACICSATTASYVVTFSADCSSFKTTLIDDLCADRAIGVDGFTFTR